MTVKFDVHGQKRKEMSQHISSWLGVEVKYLGAPSFAYKIGDFIIDKDGILEIPDSIKDETAERLLEYLYENNFCCDLSFIDTSSEETTEPTGLSISMPKENFDEQALINLEALVRAKNNLFKAAFSQEEIKLEVTEDKVSFPWFPEVTSPADILAYETFVTFLCDMARKQKKITAKEKDIDNEKYAFRCFLLRLGFIGDEHKASRKILLKNLTGSSAFKGGTK